MKRFKRILRLSSLVLLMVLASLGIGLTGAAPISSNKRGEYLDNEIKVELVKEEEPDATEDRQEDALS